MTRPFAPIDRLLPGLLIFWAGLSAGVAFLATPVKFLAPSLSLPVALDVGCQTFRAYNTTEIVLLAFGLILGALSAAKVRWWSALALLGTAVGLQSLWLLPALDRRVVAVLDGAPQPAPSHLHAAFIAIEALKIVGLLAFGVSQLRAPAGRTWWR